MQISEFAAWCNRCANEHGWWDEAADDSFDRKLMLVVTEIGEAYEEYRNGRALDEVYYVVNGPGQPEEILKPEGVAVELADAIIRIFDFCEQWGIPVVEQLEEKMRYNETRPYRHGNKVS